METDAQREQRYRAIEERYRSGQINQVIVSDLRIEPGQATVTIPVRPNLFHAGGIIHGSIYFKALDDACTFAIFSELADRVPVTVSFNIYFMRPFKGDLLIAKAQLVHKSRRLFIAEGEIIDANGKQVARGGGTFMSSSQTAWKESNAS